MLFSIFCQDWKLEEVATCVQNCHQRVQISPDGVEVSSFAQLLFEFGTVGLHLPEN